MAWTNDQLKAIKTTGGKIIVSAAAGSGKTAVLSERVLNYVLNGNDINKLLIVTFTNLAAIEMKERIKQKIENEALKTKDFNLIKQLTLIDSAKITTMDSFYNEIVNENFEKLGILPNFKIISQTKESILKNEVINEIFLNHIKEEDFIDLLHYFNANDYDLLKDIVFKVSSFLDAEGLFDIKIKEIINKYDSNYYKDIFFDDLKKKFIEYKKIYLNLKQELCNSSSSFDKIIITIDSEINLIEKIINASCFDELSSVLRLIDFQRLNPVKNCDLQFLYNKYKLIRNKLKKEVNDNLEEFKYVNNKVFDDQISITKSILEKLFSIVLEFKEKLRNEKKKINEFSFSDVSLFTLELLMKDGKKTNLAKEISNLYDEILIDEYQDTNNLQNIIFNMISKDGKNLFIVGDVKQSIYGFRSACPDIFINDKKNALKSSFPMLITLSKNFRSRKNVLDFCNFIFENLMSEKLGDVNYTNEEKLYNGLSFIESVDCETEIDIINDSKDIEDIDTDDVKSTLKEANFVAKKIKSLIDNKFKVCDKKGYLRDIKESDIVILLRSLSNAEIFKEALESKNISTYLNKDVTYFDNVDVKIIIALLKVIDNFYDDVSLTCVLTSSLFNVSENFLVKLKIDNKYEYLYDLMKKSTDEEIINIINILEDLREYSTKNTIIDTIKYAYNKLDVINILGINKNKLKNLNIMIKNASDFDNQNNKMLHEFICYIDDVLLDKNSFNGILPLDGKQSVTITTIHKSKGLEYPVVFLSNLSSKFNDSDIKEDFLLSSKYGVSFNIFDYEKKYKYNTVSNYVIKNKIKQMQLSEEIRVLYVALTRAKEKLILTGYTNNLKNMLLKASYLTGEDNLINDLYLEDCNSYLKWVLGCLVRSKKSKVLFDFEVLDNKTFNYDVNYDINIIDSKLYNEKINNKIKKEEYNFINVKLKNYDYSLSKTPVYLSVSDVKKTNNTYVKRPFFLSGNKRKTEIGTLYHKIFELIEIKKYNLSSLKEELNNLILNNYINEDDLKIIKLEKIFSFLTSDIYDMLLNSDFIYKEKEFNFNMDSKVYDENMNGNILVNGIIDLLFLYDDTYYILDYKTDDISDINELTNRYKLQLDLYEIAVKKMYNTNSVKKIIYSIKLDKYIYV